MRRWVLAGSAALALAGCQQTNVAADATALAPAPLVQRDGVSLADATVALATLEGAPPAAADDFREALTRQIAAHGVTLSQGKSARYLLRIYLSATPAEGGADLDYVADVFDASRVRVARLGDGFSLKGSGDAWSLANTKALDSVADQCARDLAAVLSQQPETKVSYVQ